VSYSLDFLIITTFFLIQWRVNMLLLRASRKRLSGRGLSAARSLVLLLNLALALGFAVTYSEVISLLRLSPRITPFLGAATLIYFATAGVAVVLHALWSWISIQLLAPMNRGRRTLLKAAGSSVAAAPVLVFGYGALIERLNFRVRETDIPIAGLPDDLHGLRILQLSDIHLSAFLSERDLERVIDSANELKAHVAVVTGDLISSRGDPLDACIEQIARLRSDAGIWGCLGNHERYAGVEDYTAAAAAAHGVRFLRNEAEPLRFGKATLNLVGVDYQPWSKHRRYLPGAERLTARGAVNVLLSHNPDVFPVAARQGYDLLLAGHTHGGQISVEILHESLNPARFFTPFIYGLYRSGTSSAYVSRGIGTIGLPVRLGAPPEISLLRLRKA
jgi:predicted MPP superfamily phosphohydrolase